MCGYLRLVLSVCVRFGALVSRKLLNSSATPSLRSIRATFVGARFVRDEVPGRKQHSGCFREFPNDLAEPCFVFWVRYRRVSGERR